MAAVLNGLKILWFGVFFVVVSLSIESRQSGGSAFKASVVCRYYFKVLIFV